jgi:phosphopantothenoylcysteine decarboxylase/phosphopantothenate--cysteine ligase
MGLVDGKLIVVGISGGIAAYRSCELVRLFVKDGATVQVVMTEASAQMVGPVTFQALSGRPVEVGSGGKSAEAGMSHIDFGRDADLVIVAPATANTLAKVAHGLADNLLTSTILASTCPVLLAPAMNTRMWQNQVTQENMQKLAQQTRISIVGPGTGQLACGEEGPGRMEEPKVIFEAAVGLLKKKDLTNKRYLITAGPTRQAIDSVRFITNHSSGKMGYALAAAAHNRGAQVTLVSGPVSIDKPYGVELVKVTTAAEMAEAVKKSAPQSDVVIMAAAVADYTPKSVEQKKIKKKEGSLSIELERTEDILASLGKKKGKQFLVGFAAEWGDPVVEARRKLKAKNLDLIVANDISQADAGFGVETNRVILIDQKGSQELPKMSKLEVADRILDRLT